MHAITTLLSAGASVLLTICLRSLSRLIKAVNHRTVIHRLVWWTGAAHHSEALIQILNPFDACLSYLD